MLFSLFVTWVLTHCKCGVSCPCEGDCSLFLNSNPAKGDFSRAWTQQQEAFDFLFLLCSVYLLQSENSAHGQTNTSEWFGGSGFFLCSNIFLHNYFFPEPFLTYFSKLMHSLFYIKVHCS